MLSIISILVFAGPFLGEIYTSETVLLTARRFASTGTSYNPWCLSVSVRVCPSQVGVLSKRMDGSSSFSAWRLHSTYPALHCRPMEIWMSPEIGVLWELYPKLRTFRKFRHGKSIVLSTRPVVVVVVVVVVVNGRACWRHIRQRRAVALYYTSVNCNPLR